MNIASPREAVSFLFLHDQRMPMKRFSAYSFLIASVVAIAGCDGDTAASIDPAAVATAPKSEAAVTEAAQQEITKDSPIWFEPESVSTCPGVQPIVGVVHWNASSFPGVTTVQVTLPSAGKADGMLAVAGTIGQKETGAWLAAGTEFVLRDNANGSELARAKMPGVPCTP